MPGRARPARGPLAALLGALLALAAPPAAAELGGDDAFSAVLRAEGRAVLSARAEGLVTAVTVREGARVEAGQTLLTFDCTLAEAALGRADARHRYAETDHGSNRRLAALNSISELELAASAMQLAEAASDVLTARHAVEGCTVTAPFDGVVTRRSIEPHERVPGGTELLALLDDASLVVEFLAPSDAIGRLEAGGAFALEIGESGEVRTGRIETVVPEIDAVNRTVTVIGRLDDAADTENAEGTAAGNAGAPALVSGMSGWVVLE